MTVGMIEMHRKKVERVGVVQRAVNKQVAQKAAADPLGLSVRRVQRQTTAIC